MGTLKPDRLFPQGFEYTNCMASTFRAALHNVTHYGTVTVSSEPLLKLPGAEVGCQKFSSDSAAFVKLCFCPAAQLNFATRMTKQASFHSGKPCRTLGWDLCSKNSQGVAKPYTPIVPPATYLGNVFKNSSAFCCVECLASPDRIRHSIVHGICCCLGQVPPSCYDEAMSWISCH